MADETNAVAESDVNQPRTCPEEDWLLQDVVRMINHLEAASVGVTLTLPGGVITGELISLRQYFHEYAAQWKEAFRALPEVAETVEQQWKEFGDENSKSLKETNEALFSYIHLKNATFITANGVLKMGGRGLLWRGRISTVSGFAIGSAIAPKVG